MAMENLWKLGLLPQADWSIAAWINPSVQPAQSGSYLLSKGSTDYGLFVAWLKWG
jgi:hypothetical protein